MLKFIGLLVVCMFFFLAGKNDWDKQIQPTYKKIVKSEPAKKVKDTVFMEHTK